MSISPDNPEYGFQFPGVFEITAMGSSEAGLAEEVPRLLELAGLIILRETLIAKSSSGGKYVSIRISFEARDRTDYETAHRSLRAHPAVKWTL